MIQVNTIHNEDTFLTMQKIKDGSVDLIICDGPYGVTNFKWDNIANIQEFNLKLIKIFSQKLKEGGSAYIFGKHDCIDFIDYRPYLTLKKKIIWYQPCSLSQGRICYTNNYDIIAYFVKGSKAKTFNLDLIRVPQLVELEHRLRCQKVPSVKNGKFGKTKFNDSGKNPGDVWGDIKQLTYNSKELVGREFLNTIQKPEKLIERMVLASSNEDELVWDPFCGVATVPVVCKKLNRQFIASEIDPISYRAGKERLDAAKKEIKKEAEKLSKEDINWEEMWK